MKRKKRKFGIVAALLLPAAMLLAIGLAAAGQGNGPAATEATSSVLVPAADFVDDGLIAHDYAFDDLGGYTFPITKTSTCMQAPVHLPDGATVSSFGGYVYDNDPDGYLDAIELRRVDYTPGQESISQVMAKASTDKAATDLEVKFVSVPSIEYPLIDNSNYIYYSTVCMNRGVAGDRLLRLYAVEATYNQ